MSCAVPGGFGRPGPLRRRDSSSLRGSRRRLRGPGLPAQSRLIGHFGYRIAAFLVLAMLACSTSTTESGALTPGDFRVRIDSARRSPATDTVALYITAGDIHIGTDGAVTAASGLYGGVTTTLFGNVTNAPSACSGRPRACWIAMYPGGTPGLWAVSGTAAVSTLTLRLENVYVFPLPVVHRFIFDATQTRAYDSSATAVYELTRLSSAP